MDREARIARLIDRLEALRAGRVTCLSFLDELDDLFAGLDLDPVFANLHHYIGGEDIREREPGYRAMQEAELDKIALLRAGAPSQDLRRITFLGRSRWPTARERRWPSWTRRA
jgi:hypothetical protein